MKNKGRLLTGKELKFAAANKIPVWYEEIYDNPFNKHYTFKGKSIMEEAGTGYYIGNSDIEPDLFVDDEEIFCNFEDGTYAVYAYGDNIYE